MRSVPAHIHWNTQAPVVYTFRLLEHGYVQTFKPLSDPLKRLVRGTDLVVFGPCTLVTVL